MVLNFVFAKHVVDVKPREAKGLKPLSPLPAHLQNFTQMCMIRSETAA